MLEFIFSQAVHHRRGRRTAERPGRGRPRARETALEAPRIDGDAAVRTCNQATVRACNDAPVPARSAGAALSPSTSRRDRRIATLRGFHAAGSPSKKVQGARVATSSGAERCFAVVAGLPAQSFARCGRCPRLRACFRSSASSKANRRTATIGQGSVGTRLVQVPSTPALFHRQAAVRSVRCAENVPSTLVRRDGTVPSSMSSRCATSFRWRQ